MTQRCAVFLLLKEHRCLHGMSPWAFTWSTDIDIIMMMAMASRACACVAVCTAHSFVLQSIYSHLCDDHYIHSLTVMVHSN